MKISGSYEIALPRDETYRLLQDPGVLAKAMPGCESLERIGPDEYAMKMKMAIASIAGQFTGKVQIAEPRPPESFRLLVEGNGKIGFLKGQGELKLEPKQESTTIVYEGDVQVGGTMAAVGQRLIDTTSRMMIRKFFEGFAAEAAARSGQ